MNKKVALLASLCLLLITMAVSAQDEMKDFSGDWKLNLDKSELGERSRVESMTMKVRQSETELSVTRKAKRKGRDASVGGAMGGGNRGRGRQRMRTGGIPSVKYDLSGKETTLELADGIMTGETRFKAKSDKGKLMLTQNRTLNTPRGKRKVKTVETWELSADGKTLTVSSVTETPRGNRNSKMVFDKSINGMKSKAKVPTIMGDFDTYDASSNSSPVLKANPDQAEDINDSGNRIPSRISAGVVNGKAKRIPAPEYPQAARLAGITGSVSVQVIIDKKGKVMSAKALSGHPLLRSATVDAARKAEFRPTLLQGQPVEVSGVIIYNYQ